MQNEPILLMWSLGPAEIAMLLVLAIFVFGPKRLPELGKALGDTLRSFKDASKGSGDSKSLPPADSE